MKKNIIYISLLVFFATVVTVINRSKREAAKGPSDADFAVPDIGSVERILLSDKNGTADLRREADHWKINGRYKVMPPKMNVLLETIQKVSVHSPVSHIQRNAVLREFEADAVKVSIFHRNEEKPFKVYYVGGTTADSKGTYMLMEMDGKKSDKPYVMVLMGFEGILNVRYFTDEEEWRDTKIFDYKLKEIRQVSVQYPLYPEHSFYILAVNQDSFEVYRAGDAKKQERAEQINKQAVVQYLSSFEFLNAEAFANSNSKKDSVINSTPFVNIAITDQTNAIRQMTVFYLPLNRRSKTQFDVQGNPLPYDLDRYYALINNGKDFVYIQEFVFGKIFKKYSDFLPRK